MSYRNVAAHVIEVAVWATVVLLIQFIARNWPLALHFAMATLSAYVFIRLVFGDGFDPADVEVEQ